VVDIVVFETV